MAQAAANLVFIGMTLAVMVCENTVLAKIPVKTPPICAALAMPGIIYPKTIVSDAKPKAPKITSEIHAQQWLRALAIKTPAPRHKNQK